MVHSLKFIVEKTTIKNKFTQYINQSTTLAIRISKAVGSLIVALPPCYNRNKGLNQFLLILESLSIRKHRLVYFIVEVNN